MGVELPLACFSLLTLSLTKQQTLDFPFSAYVEPYSFGSRAKISVPSLRWNISLSEDLAGGISCP